MGDVEALTQLAGLQALYKQLGEILSTKNPDGLRGQVDSRLHELWETTGVDRLRLMIGDVEVGKLTAKISKPQKRTTMYVNDPDALLMDDAVMLAFVRAHAREYAEFYLEQTGAVPDGCELGVEDVPAKWQGTTITGCKPQQVLPMLGVGRVAGYIEEG